MRWRPAFSGIAGCRWVTWRRSLWRGRAVAGFAGDAGWVDLVRLAKEIFGKIFSKGLFVISEKFLEKNFSRLFARLKICNSKMNRRFTRRTVSLNIGNLGSGGVGRVT